MSLLSRVAAAIRPAPVELGLAHVQPSKIPLPDATPPSPVAKVVYVDDFRRSPPAKRYRDLPMYGNDVWDNVGQVRSALADLDRGMFAQAALMVDAMMADDRISGVWSCRADGLVGLPLDLKPPDGLDLDKRALEVCEDAEKAWERMSPEQAITDLLKWGRFLGFGLAEKLYDPGSWTPRLKTWHPRFAWWNWGTRTYNLVTQDGVIDLDPEDPETLRKWVIYAPYGYQRGWVQARVRSLAIPWLIRQWAYRDWARHNEVHGIPIRKVKVPSAWDDDEKQRALAEIAQLATESVIRCPVDDEGNGFDLELVEPQGNSYEAFEHLIAKADTAIAVVLLGQNLTTEIADKGSRAAAQVHDRVRQDVIRSDSQTLALCLRNGVLREWTVYNHGDPELTPRLSWDIVPPRDEQQLGSALKATADALLTLRQTQLPVDFQAMSEEFGIPFEDGVEIGEYVDPTVTVAKEKAAAPKPKPGE